MSFETVVGRLPSLVEQRYFNVNILRRDSLYYYKEIQESMPTRDVRSTVQDRFASHVGRMATFRMHFERQLPAQLLPRSAVSLGYGGLWSLYTRRARELFEERWMVEMLCASSIFSAEHNLGSVSERQCRDAEGICEVAYEMISPSLWTEFYMHLCNANPKEIPSVESVAAITKRALDHWLFSCERGEK